MAARNGLSKVRAIWNFIKSRDSPGFDRVLEKVEIISGENGSVTGEMKIDEEHLNRGGTLHGGLTATLVDSISTLGLITSKRQASGVSVDLHVTYIGAAKPGETLLIEAHTNKFGKSLAFLSVEIKTKETGKLIARGTHTKYLPGTDFNL